jgi:hypothetical protein
MTQYRLVEEDSALDEYGPFHFVERKVLWFWVYVPKSGSYSRAEAIAQYAKCQKYGHGTFKRAIAP